MDLILNITRTTVVKPRHKNIKDAEKDMHLTKIYCITISIQNST